MTRFRCPYLGNDVELTDERERHIAECHPDILPEYQDQIAATLVDPDRVRCSSWLPNAKMFSRWFDQVRSGKHVVVVVMSDKARNWIITAYLSRKLKGGELEWNRS